MGDSSAKNGVFRALGGRALRAIRTNLMTIDPRSLAAFRVAVSVLLLWDLVARFRTIELFYTNAGIFPGYYGPIASAGAPQMSLLLGMGTATQVRVFFVVAGLVYTAFGLGYRTKTTHLLTLLCAASLHLRSSVLTYGGDIIIQAFLLWTLFVPIGRAWSVDGWLARRHGEPWDSRPVVSFAVLGVVFELALVYIFNAVDKNGAAWHDGEAIHYALWLDAIVLPAGVWMREHAPMWLLAGLNYGTLIVEGVGGVLLLSPWKTGWMRLVALSSLAALHIGIMVTINVGPFSPTMLAVYTLFITPGGWARIQAALQRFGRGHWVVLPPSEPPPVPAAGSTPGRLRRFGTVVRESLAVTNLFAAFVGASAFNPGLPQALRMTPPAWTYVWMSPFNVYHGWGLFSPEPPRNSGWFVIEAETVDGRVIDPLTGGSPLARFPPGFANRWTPMVYCFGQSMRGLAQTTYAYDVSLFVWRSHTLPGRTEADRIIRYRAWDVGRPSPPPGSTKVGPEYRRLLIVQDTRPEGLPW